jgi:hypothetical protein
MMVDLNRRQFLHLHYLPFEVLTMIAQNIRRGDHSNYESLIAFASSHSTLQQFGECELYYHIRIHDRNTPAKLLRSFNIKRLRKYAWNTKTIALGHGLKRGFDPKDLERLAQYCTNVEEFTIVEVRLQRVRGADPGVDLFGVGESINFHKLKCRLMRNDSDRQQRVSKN